MNRASGLPPAGATAGTIDTGTVPAGPDHDSTPARAVDAAPARAVDAAPARAVDAAPARSGDAAPGRSEASPAVATYPAGAERDIIVRKMNDVVIRRIFAAGLDLQAALGLLGEDGTPARHETGCAHGTLGAHQAANKHRAASKIWHATDELDHVIRDIRNILFEPW